MLLRPTQYCAGLNFTLEYLHKESRDIEGEKFVKQNGFQILFIQ